MLLSNAIIKVLKWVFYFFFQVMKEVQSALNTAAADDSKLVLFSAVGSIFCCGLDFIYFIRRLTDDRKKESTKMAEAIRYVNVSSDIGGGIFHCLVWLDLFYFKKPLIQQYLRHSHLLREKCAALLYTPLSVSIWVISCITIYTIKF